MWNDSIIPAFFVSKSDESLLKRRRKTANSGGKCLLAFCKYPMYNEGADEWMECTAV